MAANSGETDFNSQYGESSHEIGTAKKSPSLMLIIAETIAKDLIHNRIIVLSVYLFRNVSRGDIIIRKRKVSVFSCVFLCLTNRAMKALQDLNYFYKEKRPFYDCLSLLCRINTHGKPNSIVYL